MISTHAASYYWVGGSGNWSDINHWATASGGATKHIVVPSPGDDVIFDHNSFTSTGQTVFIDLLIATARNFSINNVQHQPSINGGNQLRIYGSLKLSRLVNWGFSGSFYFEAVTPGHTLLTDSITLINDVYFQGIGGNWTLLDILDCTRSIYLHHGNLNTNGKPVFCLGFFSTQPNTRTLSLGSSVITIRDYLSLATQNLTLNSGQSVVIMQQSANFSTTGTAPAVFHTVWFKNYGNISGTIHYDTLRFSPGMIYHVSGSSTISKRLDAVGTCVRQIEVNGPWTLSMPVTAQFMVEYAKIGGVSASGGAAFTAYESIDKGMNSGITFAPLTPFNLYWVGGSGEWQDTAHWSYNSGGPGGACIPRPIDDVWFDANSFITGDSVVIKDQIAECRHMRWVNIPPDIWLRKYENLYIYGSLWLHHRLTWFGAASETFFASANAETITTDNVVLTGPVYFDGAGSWTLQDSFTVEGNGVDHVRGTWNTNNQPVSVYVYHTHSGLQRTLNLGSTHFKVNSANVQAWTLNGSGFTLNAGTSTIDITAPDGGMYNASTFGFTFYHVIFSDSNGLGQLNTDINNFFSLTFNSNGFIRGNNTIGTLTFTKGKDYKLGINNTQTIVNLFNAVGGCDGYILIHSEQKEYLTEFYKQSGVVNGDFLIMWNVVATGGAVFSATNSVDLGGNNGWVFTSPAPKSLYWVGGSGNWSDVNHWSLTSGGPGGACVPSPLDSVFFDANSFLNPMDSVKVDLTNATCHTMTWKDTLPNALLTGSLYNALWFWGSVIFNSTMSNMFAGDCWFEASDTGHVIVSAGNRFNQNMIFDGRGGGWSVTDSLWVERGIALRYGAVYASGKPLRAASFRTPIGSERVFDFSHSLFTIAGTEYAWQVVHDSLTFLAAGSHIDFIAGGFIDFINSKNSTDTVNYHNITFRQPFSFASMQSFNARVKIHIAEFKGHGIFKSSYRYDSLIFSGGRTYRFSGNTTQKFLHLSAHGNCFEPIEFSSFTPATPTYYLHNLTSSAQINHVTLEGCHGIPPSTYTATNSFDLGGNQQWVITPVGPVDLYWVNGTGKWWNPSHWSYSSGGPGGACIPTHRDNVFFDQNSFLTANDTVMLDSLFAECHDMQWINLNTNPAFLQQGIPLEIHGSLRLDTAIIGNFQGHIRFLSTHTGNYIYSGSQVFQDSVVFNGSGGDWTLHDSLTAQRVISLINGNLNTNGQTVTGGTFLSITNYPRQLTLGSSVIKLQGLWRANGLNLILNAGQSHIMLRANNAQMINEHGSGFVYHNLSFMGTALTSTLRCNTVPVRFNRVLFNNSANIYGEHVFDSLLMMPGNLYQLEKGKTQTINDYWLLRGNNCFPLTLQSTMMGQQATVLKNSGSVIGDFNHIRDMVATGGATFFAGDNSTNISNNQGWTFSNSPGYIFGLGPDIEFTIGTSITLTTANFNTGPGTTYLWSTGATTSSIIVNQPDTYSVTVTYAGNCVVVDTIIVYCNVKPQYTIGDCICHGDSTGWIGMTITDTVGTYSAIWSHGANQLNVSGLSAGQYIVTIYGSTGCNGKDTLWVKEPPPIILPLNDTSFCEDTTGVLLDATKGYVQYFWNGQPGGSTLFVTQPDTIIVVVEDANGCRNVPDTLVISVDTIPHIWLGDDAEICLGEKLVLSPGIGFHNYWWQDGSTKPQYTATQGGVYYVTIRLRTCYNSDTIYLFDCPPEIIFPNVFTPNSDGANDYFFPLHQNIIRYHLVIYNRWGTVVFESKDPNGRWDGTAHGQPCPTGTYFFAVDYAGFGQRETGGSKLHRGVVTLLR
jgi:gliding motility-associated-like protein